MREKYIVVKNTYLYKNFRIGYGVALIEEQDGVIVVLDSVSDLSPNESEVTALVEICNAEQLSSIHFKDIVNDFISSL